MKYSLLLSFAFTTALLASTTSAGAIFSKSNPPAPSETAPIKTAPTEVVNFDHSTPRRPVIKYLKDETFEALISGNEILVSSRSYDAILRSEILKSEKFTKNQWTEDEIKDEMENRIYSKCRDEAGTGQFAFIDKQIEVASDHMVFQMTWRSISLGHVYLLQELLKRGKSKISPENYLKLIKVAFDRAYLNRKSGITETVLRQRIDISTVDLEAVIILALESEYTRNGNTVNMLLAKKGPDFTGGRILLAIARQELFKNKRRLSGASIKLPRKEYDKHTYYDNRPAFMVRLLNEGDMDTKYDNYAALKHLIIGKSKSEHLRYFLKAGKVDLSDVAKVEDAVILEKLDYLSKLVAEEPPAEYRELDDGFLYSNLEYDCGGVKPRYTGTNKWEMHYYAGAGAEAK